MAVYNCERCGAALGAWVRAGTLCIECDVWVELHPDLDAAIRATLAPRDDRDSSAKLFGESNRASLRRA